MLCYTGKPEYALLTTTRGNHVLQYSRKMLHATDKMSPVANGAMCLHLACHVAMKSLELMARVPQSIPAQLTVVLKFNMMYYAFITTLCPFNSNGGVSHFVVEPEHGRKPCTYH
jgi:hypothetical protein